MAKRRGKHEYNKKLAAEFLKANKKKAYHRREITKNTGVSFGAVKSIAKQLVKENLVERHLVKERDGSLRTYYNWKRCEHLAGSRCVIREVDCRKERLCCISCDARKVCDQTVCPIALKHIGTESDEDSV